MTDIMLLRRGGQELVIRSCFYQALLEEGYLLQLPHSQPELLCHFEPVPASSRRPRLQADMS